MRGFADACFTDGELIILCSKASVGGGHGCGIAINSSIPWAFKPIGDTRIPAKTKLLDVSIEHAEPRMLIVGITPEFIESMNV